MLKTGNSLPQGRGEACGWVGGWVWGGYARTLITRASWGRSLVDNRGGGGRQKDTYHFGAKAPVLLRKGDSICIT